MKTSLSFIILVLFFSITKAQPESSEYSLLFYNVENLFDVKNDSLTNDDEFTPGGERFWTYPKLERKLLNISKAILSSGGWNVPSIIGLCEVENRYVLERLRNETPLKSTPYKIVHKESPDFRGIDVALLYNSDEFYPLKYEYFPLIDKNGTALKSREILYVSGILGGVDTIHVYVNHWPSRYSGVMETRELRNAAAKLLNKKIAEIQNENETAKIIVVGDFNDQPNNESLSKYLGAKKTNDSIKSGQLYNLSTHWDKPNEGTLKYQSQWFTFDQIIVSAELLNEQSKIYTKPKWADICRKPFLLMEDKTYGGVKPARTYSGYKYQGGFSDHLPIILRIGVN